PRPSQKFTGGELPVSPGCQHVLGCDEGCPRRLNTIDVPPAATIVRRREIGELLGDAVGGYFRPGSGRAAEEVDAVARQGRDVVRSADNANGEIRNIVIGATTIRKTGWIERRHSHGIATENR